MLELIAPEVRGVTDRDGVLHPAKQKVEEATSVLYHGVAFLHSSDGVGELTMRRLPTNMVPAALYPVEGRTRLNPVRGMDYRPPRLILPCEDSLKFSHMFKKSDQRRRTMKDDPTMRKLARDASSEVANSR